MPRMVFPVSLARRPARFAAATRAILVAAVLAALGGGCAVVAVADAAVSVAATAVKVTATVVETTVDVTAAGVRAVAGSQDEKKPSSGPTSD